jgi:hypothetical protein
LSPRKIQVRLADPATLQIMVRYQGAPRSGLTFAPERRVMYAVRPPIGWSWRTRRTTATLRLRLIVPRAWEVVSNGREVARETINDRADLSEWLQDRPVLSCIRLRSQRLVAHYTRGEWSRAATCQWLRRPICNASLAVAGMLEFFRGRAGVVCG